MRAKGRLAVMVVVTLVIGVLSVLIAGWGLDDGRRSDGTPQRTAVPAETVYDHLEMFQALADEHGNRAAGTPGYEAAGRYVEQQLRAAGYQPQRQYFSFTYRETVADLIQTSPDQVEHPHVRMAHSPPTPAGGVSGELTSPDDQQGCTAEAYGGADLTGRIAMVGRSDCLFSDQALAAGEVNAEGLVVYNDESGNLEGDLDETLPGHVPTTGISQDLGRELLAEMDAGPVTLTLDLRRVVEERESFNLVAETDRGSDDNVVMLGAHLDGVQEGPGISDNASGSAAILHAATRLSEADTPHRLNNKVRFVWWGAEEVALDGSRHYVDDLVRNDPARLDAIAVYLNFDMVASPNYVIGVYDADESSFPVPDEIPDGSAEAEEVFTDYFDAQAQPWVDIHLSIASDQEPFMAAGVPVSGLFTGSSEDKSRRHAELFGGTAGAPRDPNYHTAGDDLGNIDREALDIMSEAIAHAAVTLAEDTSAINGIGGDGEPGEPVPDWDVRVLQEAG